MLVLSRKIGEEIVIGDNIRVRVVEIRGNRVKIGLDGPAEVVFRRQELLPEQGQSRSVQPPIAGPRPIASSSV